MKDLCKRNGTYSSDDAFRSGCGCMNGTVVYAGGQNCQSDGNFVGGAKCEILRTMLAISALQSSLEAQYAITRPGFLYAHYGVF